MYEGKKSAVMVISLICSSFTVKVLSCHLRIQDSYRALTELRSVLSTEGAQKWGRRVTGLMFRACLASVLPSFSSRSDAISVPGPPPHSPGVGLGELTALLDRARCVAHTWCSPRGWFRCERLGAKQSEMQDLCLCLVGIDSAFHVGRAAIIYLVTTDESVCLVNAAEMMGQIH